MSFALIFIAELGDKSQLVALWFATQYRWWLVIIGVTVATLVVHLASTAIGATVSDLLPEPVILTIVGLSFFAFAAWGLRGDSIEERQAVKQGSVLASLGVVTVAFFISELGDKTQLATISLGGSNEDFVGVWLGSTVGMVAADALAIMVGVFAGKRLPERTIAKVAALLFALFGAASIGQAVLLALD
ncbi:MAG: TMEM165/GDT1 family protein [Dehalococcoidia bacterium]